MKIDLKFSFENSPHKDKSKNKNLVIKSVALAVGFTTALATTLLAGASVATALATTVLAVVAVLQLLT